MPNLIIREAVPADVPQILTFIRELALYEGEPHAVEATEADLLRDGFTEPKRFHWPHRRAGKRGRRLRPLLPQLFHMDRSRRNPS